MSSKIRIIIINRDWYKGLAYPKFEIEGLYSSQNPEQNQELKLNEPKLIPLPVASFSEGNWQEMKKIDDIEDCLLYPTELDLTVVSGKEKMDEMANYYFEKMIEGILKNYKSNQDVEILFLMHKGDGFDNVGVFLEGLKNKEDSYKKKKINLEIKVETFGNGIGMIYKAVGLLAHSYSNFRYDKASRVGKFEKKAKTYAVKEINIENFERVWDNYWYHTIKRIESYKKLINNLAIKYSSKSQSGVDDTDDLKLKSQCYTYDLLHHWKVFAIKMLKENHDLASQKGYDEPDFKSISQKIEQFGEKIKKENKRSTLPKLKWDFSHCKDLTNWISDDNADHTQWISWIRQLLKLENPQPKEVVEITKILNEVIFSYENYK